MSLNSQEFISYHIRDVIENLTAEQSYDARDYYLATGTYEQQKNGDLFGIAKGRT